MRHTLRVAGLLVILTLAMLSPGGASPGEAGSLVVTTTADSGAGSFRQALEDAGTNPDLDVITFDPGVFPEANPATIHATEVHVLEAAAASQPLTIDGTGAGVILDGDGVAAGGGAIHFRPTGPMSGITLKHFTIQNFIGPTPDEDGHGVEIGYQPTDVSDVLIEDLTVRDNQGLGIYLRAGAVMSNVEIRNSEISGNGEHGLFLGGESLDNVVVENNIIRENGGHGVELKADSSAVPASVRLTENDIRDNGRDGIFVAAEAGNGPHVTISRNATTANNGLGIDLEGGSEDGFGVTANDPGDGDDGPNKLLNFPVINGVAPTGIVGTACAGCTVELFIGDSDPSGHGEGANFFASGQADDDGNFEIDGCGQAGGATVTATATDPDGNTSEFAENYTLPATPPCAELNGDPDCDGDVDGRDALVLVIHDSDAAQLSREVGCPELGSPLAQPASAAGPDVFGDVNCDADVGAGDAVTILQFLAEVALVPPPPAGCVPVGEPLPE